jgi:hypothetical protein
MSYASGEAEIRNIIVAGSALFTANTVISLANNTPQGGQHVLDSGRTDIYVYLEENGFTAEHITIKRVVYTWNTSVELWTRYKAPGESEARRDAARQSVLDTFAGCDTLNDAAISGVKIASGDKYVTLRAEGRQSGAPSWFMQRLNLEWQEVVTT